MAELLSIAIPIYNEEPIIRPLCERLRAATRDLDMHTEILFVDDGSTDGSVDLLKREQADDRRIKIIRLSRNFGHQAALTAGLEMARGDAVIVMDGDLQDPPEVIPDLVAAWRKGNKIVLAYRSARKDGLVRRGVTRLFYALMELACDADMPVGAGVFGLMDRQAADVLRGMRERNRFLPGLRSYVGFQRAVVWYEREARAAGAPKQTVRALTKYALDGIFSFSYKPLRLSLFFGGALSALCVCYGLVLVALRLLDLNVVHGFTTIAVAVLFLGGIQLVSIGILGEYLGRVYDEIKRRPLYVIDQVIEGRCQGDGSIGEG